MQRALENLRFVRRGWGWGHPLAHSQDVQAGPAPASPLQPQPGKVAMPAPVTHLRALALPAIAGALLLVHPAADARRFDATVIVGRVTSGGVPIADA
jgi:hypothetical protein